jgi:hypothetical protein
VFVALDPVVDPADRPLRSENVQRLITVEIGTDQPVESHEVVDIVVRDEGRGEVAWAVRIRAGQLAGIEQQRIVAPRIIDLEDRISGRAVDQADARDGARFLHRTHLIQQLASLAPGEIPDFKGCTRRV